MKHSFLTRLRQSRPHVLQRLPHAHPRLRRGVTLVELMVAMLILAIVCVAWLEIIGIQSARREARRREAVERLAGMMDAFMYLTKTEIPAAGSYYLDFNPAAGSATSIQSSSFKSINDQDISKPFPDSFPDPDDHENSPPRDLLSLDPIGYRLVVVNNLSTLTVAQNQELFGGKASSFTGNWRTKPWLIGLLYDKQGKGDEVSKSLFFRLPVCLGVE